MWGIMKCLAITLENIKLKKKLNKNIIPILKQQSINN